MTATEVHPLAPKAGFAQPSCWRRPSTRSVNRLRRCVAARACHSADVRVHVHRSRTDLAACRSVPTSICTSVAVARPTALPRPVPVVPEIRSRFGPRSQRVVTWSSRSRRVGIRVRSPAADLLAVDEQLYWCAAATNAVAAGDDRASCGKVRVHCARRCSHRHPDYRPWSNPLRFQSVFAPDP